MKQLIFKEADKIWKDLTRGVEGVDLHFELEVYKGLLNFFMPGEYYYYIFNVKEATFDFMSQEVTDVLGYSTDCIDVPFFISKIHPDDQPWFLNFENKVAAFFSTLSPKQIPNYKVRYDYRIQKKDGNYIRVLQQVVTIQLEGEKILRTFGVHTDITNIKQKGAPVLSFLGLNGEPSYIDVKADKIFNTNISGLTNREFEIMLLVVQGKKSEEISKSCFISKQTVNTHRRNLLYKTGCVNAAELTALAIEKGWV